jgi:magnesium transporter
MERPILEHTLEQLRKALERDDLASAANIIEAMRPADQADLFAELEEAQQHALLPKIAPEDSADILEELDDEAVAELVDALSNEAVVRIMDEMEPDEVADLLGDIHPERAAALLSGLEDPEEVRPLMIHPDESAGGLMTTEFLVLRRRMTAAEAIEAFRQWNPDAETIYYLYVADQFGRLSGVVNLRQLILADPNTLIMDLMETKLISVGPDTDQEEAAQLLLRYDLLALPVVDDQKRLLGVITVDDVMDVLEEEATEDIQRYGGAQPLERPYLDTPPGIITRKRIGWLLLLFITATLTGSVMRLFQDDLQAVVALAVFIPLLIGTGGNAGSQTTATIIRALATRDIEPKEAFWVWWHEARVGVLLGLGMAVVAYIRAITWDPDPALAITVSVSILALVFWATSVGSILPLAAARLGIDPALVSGPLMSTLVDATGLFIYFTIAGIILGL